MKQWYQRRVREYQTAYVPPQYPNKLVYEAIMKNPIGKNWNPSASFDKLTLPAVTVKSGQIIEPIENQIKDTGNNSAGGIDKKPFRARNTGGGNSGRKDRSL
eukprot:TRINITY_DN11535_c0_g1_i12.p1 TRINITY_DN11535_c0_g1~~TRINITY_DN11535_c0_g1_i12.p1  ORF type:complete len:102 (+),score=26.32 TRINITY_DN11535_c0_g1_i12:22-327(+)